MVALVNPRGVGEGGDLYFFTRETFLIRAPKLQTPTLYASLYPKINSRKYRLFDYRSTKIVVLFYKPRVFQ